MKKVLLTAGAAVAAAPAVFAATPDPASVVTTATTAFEAVATLSMAMLGFFVVFRIVKSIRK